MIIVTGGAGFIGSNVLAGLEDAGVPDLVACDTFGSGEKWKNIGKRELRDVIAPEHLAVYLNSNKSKIKMIYHLGGISDTTATDADAVIASNFNLSRLMWQWAAQNGVRLVYASAGSTYGDGTHGFSDEGSPESLSKLQPLNPYGWSKHLFDRSVARAVANKTEPLPPQWVGLKFFNVYGPNEYHKGDQRSVPTKLFPQVDAGAAVKLYRSTNAQFKDGEQMRDFIYIRDCVEVCVWMYQNPGVSGLFNLGTGKARSFNDLASAMFAAAGKKQKIQYIDMAPDLVARYQNYTQADMGKLRAAGYDKPFTELEVGVEDYVKNYLSMADKFR